MSTPFFVAATIDAIYQTIVHQAIYLFELLFTATLLAVVPMRCCEGRRTGSPGCGAASGRPRAPPKPPK